MRQANCSHLLVNSVLKADVKGTAFTVSCPENCSGPETLPSRQAHYIAELPWRREEQKTLPLPLTRERSIRISNCPNWQHYPFHVYLPHGQCTVSAGCFFSKSFWQTGQLLCHIFRPGFPLTN